MKSLKRPTTVVVQAGSGTCGGIDARRCLGRSFGSTMAVIEGPNRQLLLQADQQGQPSLVGLTSVPEPEDEPRPLVHRLGSFWRAQTVGWLFAALFGMASRLIFFESLGLATVLTIVLEPLGFLLTTFAHWHFRDRVRGITLAVILAAISLSVLGGLVQMAAANGIKALFEGLADFTLVTGDLAVPAIYYTLVFFGWSLAYLWIRSDAMVRQERLQRSRAQEAALQAELHRLRSQLDSHFLFNALNGVAMEIPEWPERALEMTRRIAAYLRYSLDHHGQAFCSLDEEVEAMRDYLRIQELRFEERVTCSLHVDPAVREIPVPHLILQPLVENAVKYGLRSASGRLVIRLAARAQASGLIVEISNSGRLQPRDGSRQPFGLASIRRRLQLHYPERHALSLQQEGEAVVARLMIWGEACYG